MANAPNPQRRQLLKLLSAASAAGLAPIKLAHATQQLAHKTLHWKNWSGDQQANPESMVYPRDEAELKRLLQNSHGTVRAVGGSHSFSPLVPTDDTLVSLEQMSGLKDHNTNTHSATFGAGTRLAMASKAAFGVGQSFINEPDVNMQSLAGAISTATHGTGTKLPSMSAQVSALRLMTPAGNVKVIDHTTPNELHAAQVSLGALGIITEVSFQNAPAYHLEETTRVMSLTDAMSLVEAEKESHRSIEFFAFPFGNTAIVKTLDITDKPNTTEKPEDSNEMLELACEVSMRAGWIIPALQKLLGYFVSDDDVRGPSYQVYPSPRTVHFNEMEYTVAADKGMEVLEEVMQAMKQSGDNVFFPIEFRYVAADDAWLSPFYQRAGASISVHQYAKQDYNPLFDQVEPVFKRHQGRPHWGKINSMSHNQARQLYPRFDDFIALQKQFDPKGRMLNSYLRQLFGATA